MREQERRRWADALARAAQQGEQHPAAVLVPLVETEEGFLLLFEVRASTLHRQPGQVCFPGGGMEAGEPPVQAALRETEEELGIPREMVTVLGEMADFSLNNTRKIFPVVGVLPGAVLEQITPAPEEVGRWFTVPVGWFQAHPPKSCRYTLELKDENAVPEEARRFLTASRQESRALWWQWGDTAIWGLTARILRRLLEFMPRTTEQAAPEAVPQTTEQAAPEAVLRTMEQTPPEPLSPAMGEETIWKLETNLDDATGEALGLTLELLLSAGARDAWYQPIFMKKSRPAWLLSVLCEESLIPKLEEVIFTHTTTIGIRRAAMERTVLPRRMERVETALGPVRVKCCTLPTGAVRAYPEYEDVAALARAAGRGYQEVYALAQRRWAEGHPEG